MKILFDNGVPSAVGHSLLHHQVTFARHLGWQQWTNGKLIQAAEEAGFDLLLTSDKNIEHQQNLTGRKLALVVLGYQQWPEVQLHLQKIVNAVDTAQPGSYCIVDIPFGRKARIIK